MPLKQDESHCFLIIASVFPAHDFVVVGSLSAKKKKKKNP
jgi:hypothetical protein